MNTEHNDPRALEAAADVATATRVPEAPARAAPTDLGPSPPGAPVTMDAARALVATAITLERELALAEAAAEAAAATATGTAHRRAVCQRRAARGWAIARHALRCAARRIPLPTNAEEQIQLAMRVEQERQTEKTVVLPEDAKEGDVFADPTTGARYVVRLVGGDLLMAFPEE